MGWTIDDNPIKRYADRTATVILGYIDRAEAREARRKFEWGSTSPHRVIAGGLVTTALVIGALTYTKLTSAPGMSWWAVTAPLWIPLGLSLLLAAGGLLAAIPMWIAGLFRDPVKPPEEA